MKILGKVYYFAAITLALASSAHAHVGSQFHPSLHNSEQAGKAYREFLLGNGSDPFSDLVHGYRNGHLHDIEVNIQPIQYEALKMKSIEQFEKNAQYFGDISEARDDKRANIYRQSFDNDGKFNPAAYAKLYASFLDEQKLVVDKHIYEGFDNLKNIMRDSNASLSLASERVAEYSAQATTNLLNEMTFMQHEKKLGMYEIYAESLSKASEISAQAASTIAIASSFSDDCGSACAMPEQPAEIVPEEPPADRPIYTPPPSYGCWDEHRDRRRDEDVFLPCP